MSPDWSPDGPSIPWWSSPLFVVSPRGNDLRQVTWFTPSWSPDGRELLFTTNHEDPVGSDVLWMVRSTVNRPATSASTGRESGATVTGPRTASASSIPDI